MHIRGPINYSLVVLNSFSCFEMTTALKSSGTYLEMLDLIAR